MNRHVLCIALVTTLTACVQTQDEHSPAAQDLADLRASAETGAAEAQWILGGMYVTGLGVPQDAAEAVAWYRRAAEQGHTRAQYNLGGMYREGLGVPQDAAEAVAWYRRAAEQGNATAQSNLGGMYAEGLGVPQDAAEAVAWYRRAAEQGNATAQSNLGGMYDQGVGVSQNFAEAVAWYRRAAEQGDARAQYNLGGMYREGLGVPQDAAGTVAWYRRAAEQGHTRAQYNLGGMYAEGLGVPPDDVEANMWLTIAASRSTGAEREQIVTARAAVAARMTPTDLREANRRAQAWHAAHRGMRNPTSPPSDTGHDTGHEGLIIALELPFSWKKPPTIFVNSMSDLFHKDVPLIYIQNVFDVMRRAGWHRFQVLTKRAGRLAQIDASLEWAPNIWMGVSVDTEKYCSRIDDLRSTGAGLKFLPLEPLLGPLPDLNLEGMDWIIVGGESGPKARPMDPAWVTDLREQCCHAGVPFFSKQWGGTNKKKAGRELEGRTWDEMPREPEPRAELDRLGGICCRPRKEYPPALRPSGPDGERGAPPAPRRRGCGCRTHPPDDRPRPAGRRDQLPESSGVSHSSDATARTGGDAGSSLLLGEEPDGRLRIRRNADGRAIRDQSNPDRVAVRQRRPTQLGDLRLPRERPPLRREQVPGAADRPTSGRVSRSPSRVSRSPSAQRAVRAYVHRAGESERQPVDRAEETV